MACGEFSLIARYFGRVRNSRLDVELGTGGDCALFNTPKKQALAISTDTLVTGNYFFSNINPADLAYRAPTVGLSDLTAMGADPTWLTLALTLPDVDEVWLGSFSNSLFDLLNYYDIRLIGDDTTRGPLSITLSTHGFVPMRRALTRSKAKPGDWIYVAGTPGNNAAGLAILQNRLQVADVKNADYSIKRHLRPSPRILQRQALHDLADSVTDLSDGLISDLGHIVKASDCDACTDLALLPFSDVLSRHAEPEQVLRWVLSGSENYGLRFTVPELNCGAPDTALGHLGVSFICIRQMTADIEGLCFIRDGGPVTLDWKGYDHFATL